MPIYEYECDNCENITEIEQSISKAIEPITECCYCGGPARKIVSKFDFKLIGRWPGKDIKRGIED